MKTFIQVFFCDMLKYLTFDPSRIPVIVNHVKAVWVCDEPE
jgi:hypothetical protein